LYIYRKGYREHQSQAGQGWAVAQASTTPGPFGGLIHSQTANRAHTHRARCRYNIRGLVIDPYNELDHLRRFESETEYVSQMLSKVKRFAQVGARAKA